MISKKPKRYYRESGDRCDRIKITFLINKEHLIMALYENLNVNGDWYKDFKPTAKSVEKEVRSHLFLHGADWFDEIDIENESLILEGREEMLDITRWKIAEAEAKRLFPKWFTNFHNKSHRFITED